MDVTGSALCRRNDQQREDRCPATHAMRRESREERNSEDATGKALTETIIGKTNEVVVPINLALADKMIQVPDENGQSATISMSENSPAVVKLSRSTKKSSPILF